MPVMDGCTSVGRYRAYEASLDSAIDALGDPSAYSTVKTDANSRSRAWTPGSPLLRIPVAPVVVYSNASASADPDSNGWPGGVLDPVAYLGRPDIQGQSIPVQMAMLGCNEAASNLMRLKNTVQQQAQDKKTEQSSGSEAGPVIPPVVQEKPEREPPSLNGLSPPPPPNRGQ